MELDFDPDDDVAAPAYTGSAIDLPWLIVGVCAAIVMAICGAAERVVRTGHRIALRVRAAAGSRLIDLGARVVPDPPGHDDDQEREQRVVAVLARARAGARRNGKARISST